jgi:hypothetical protein
MNRLVAWFRFGKRVWTSLFIGWASCLLAATPILRLDQAGALLVCMAIVAEVLHEKRHRLFIEQIQPGFVGKRYLYREVEVPGEDHKDIVVTPHQRRSDRTTVNTNRWALYHLAKPDEFFLEEKSRYWNLEGTMQRAERRLDYSIVVTAVAGTILWAFGQN